MIRTALFLILTIGVGPAAAQNSAFCQELWLSRNTVLDRVGQCFDTALGRAVFDNSNCVEGNVRLNPLDTEITRMAREMEEWAGCRVDTEAGQLDAGARPFRARLTELLTVPVRADSEHGCVGFQGPPIPLHAGMSTRTTVLGAVERGQSFALSHHPMRGGWEYLEVWDANHIPVTHGWTQDAPRNMGAVCDFAPG